MKKAKLRPLRLTVIAGLNERHEQARLVLARLSRKSTYYQIDGENWKRPHIGGICTNKDGKVLVIMMLNNHNLDYVDLSKVEVPEHLKQRFAKFISNQKSVKNEIGVDHDSL